MNAFGGRGVLFGFLARGLRCFVDLFVSDVGALGMDAFGESSFKQDFKSSSRSDPLLINPIS